MSAKRKLLLLFDVEVVDAVGAIAVVEGMSGSDPLVDEEKKEEEEVEEEENEEKKQRLVCLLRRAVGGSNGFGEDVKAAVAPIPMIYIPKGRTYEEA